jgi:hypothetical protein
MESLQRVDETKVYSEDKNIASGPGNVQGRNSESRQTNSTCEEAGRGRRGLGREAARRFIAD